MDDSNSGGVEKKYIMATRNWADDSSEDELDSDIEVEDLSKTYKAPFIAEINFSRDNVNRLEFGKYFEALGCKILKLEIQNRKAFFEFGDAESIHKCLKEDRKEILKGLSIKAKVFVSREESSNNNNRLNHGDHRDRNPDNRAIRNERSDDKDTNKFKSYSRDNKNRSSKSEISQVNTEINLVRPKIIIQPRTLPIETIGAPINKPDIFGGGKPHDEAEYEERKQKLLTTASIRSESLPPPIAKEEIASVLEPNNANIQEDVSKGDSGPLPLPPSNISSIVKDKQPMERHHQNPDRERGGRGNRQQQQQQRDKKRDDSSFNNTKKRDDSSSSNNTKKRDDSSSANTKKRDDTSSSNNNNNNKKKTNNSSQQSNPKSHVLPVPVSDTLIPTSTDASPPNTTISGGYIIEAPPLEDKEISTISKEQSKSLDKNQSVDGSGGRGRRSGRDDSNRRKNEAQKSSSNVVGDSEVKEKVGQSKGHSVVKLQQDQRSVFSEAAKQVNLLKPSKDVSNRPGTDSNRRKSDSKAGKNINHKDAQKTDSTVDQQQLTDQEKFDRAQKGFKLEKQPINSITGKKVVQNAFAALNNSDSDS